MYLPSAIVERLDVVIHKASTVTGESISFPQENEREGETDTESTKW